MHAWSMGRPRDPRLATPPWPDAVVRRKDAFLDAAVSSGLAVVAAGTEIDQLSLLLNETGYPGLVHGGACPDNVRFLNGRCRSPAVDLAAQLYFRGGPFGRASRPLCPGRRTARAAIGALARSGHRGLPGPRPARFGAGSGA